LTARRLVRLGLAVTAVVAAVVIVLLLIARWLTATGPYGG
jgi:hypothetical protein